MKTILTLLTAALKNKTVLTLLAVFGVAASTAPAQTTYTWNGASGNWHVSTNWTPNGIPGAGDTAVINAGTVQATSSVAVANVTINGGTLTHLRGLAGGLDLTLTGTLLVGASGSINVSDRGLRGGNREGNALQIPGASGGYVHGEGYNASMVPAPVVDNGASHGTPGVAFPLNGNPVQPLYGSPTDPVLFGSGGRAYAPNGAFGGNGGGLVHISAHDMVVQGAIRADGGNGTGGPGGAGGSGGSVNLLLTGGSFSGAGAITVTGGTGTGTQPNGGHGRIAMVGYSTKTFTGTLGGLGTLYLNARPVLPVIPSQSVDELTQLTVPNPATDADPLDTLTYSLVSPPPGASINGAGTITWTPTEAQGPGSFTITTLVTDNGTRPMSTTNSFTVTVNEVNTSPTLLVQTSQTVNELVLLNVNNAGSDTDFPANSLSYTLLSPPAGAAISSNGTITWTPTEAQGPGTFTITTQVTDNGTPPLNTTNTFTVTVNEVNLPPSLPTQTNKTVNELTLLTVINGGSDADIPANGLTYTLTTAPSGAAISATGTITWTPTEAQGPGVFTFTTRVDDNGSPNQFTTNTFTVTVNEVNLPPSLTTQTNKTVDELTLLTVNNGGTDTDFPANNLVHTLTTAPPGATISPAGVITWTPTEAQGPGTFTFTTQVTDNGTPPLSSTNSFDVTVGEVNAAPTLPVQTNKTVDELTQLIVTNTATDTDFPANSLAYTLLSPPDGAVISNAGVITWTPTEAQGPGVFTITTQVTDNGTPPLSSTNSFDVTVGEVNAAPTLPVQTNKTVDELTQLIVTNTATDTDFPANSLAYTLLSPPDGAVISNAGVITWTPTEAQGPGVFTITTQVTDNGTPPLSSTNSFDVTVGEVNAAPTLPVQTNKTVDELTQLIVTNTATDTDFPANSLAYTLLSPPDGAVISNAGVITWTPTEAQGPGVFTITTQVTDNGTPPLSSTNSFDVTVGEVNAAPTLPVQTNKTVDELTQLNVNNAATDTDFPANSLAYTLLSPPDGAVISNAGVITWTPTEAQGPGIFTITTQVTDNGTPPLSSTNSFDVTVGEVNAAPTLPVQTNKTVDELTQLNVNNVATDTDFPANSLAYTLLSPPDGAVISNAGVITWTPTEAQGPGVFTITTQVTDNGTPPLSTTNAFTVTVGEVNVAPVLGALSNFTVTTGQAVTFTATATDADLPANSRTFSLLSPPAGASIHPATGAFSWVATTTTTIQVRVTDNGTPVLHDTQSFTVTVGGPELRNPSIVNGEFRFEVHGPSGGNYTIEFSTNLVNWEELVRHLGAATPFTVADPAFSIEERRFYRATVSQ